MFTFASFLWFVLSLFSAHADTILTVKSTTGQDVQVKLSAVQTGLREAAVSGKLVEAESMKANADGSFSINKPKILYNGEMVEMSDDSAKQAICMYFAFASSGPDFEAMPHRADKATILPDGKIVSSSSLYSVSRVNCW